MSKKQSNYIIKRNQNNYEVVIGLEVHAGHGLTYSSVFKISKINDITEFNIGHFLISESLFLGLKNAIKKFKKVIVALDRDATTKAFDISNQLRYYINTQVKILEEDLKYYGSNQIEGILK